MAGETTQDPAMAYRLKLKQCPEFSDEAYDHLVDMRQQLDIAIRQTSRSVQHDAIMRMIRSFGKFTQELDSSNVKIYSMMDYLESKGAA